MPPSQSQTDTGCGCLLTPTSRPSRCSSTWPQRPPRSPPRRACRGDACPRTLASTGWARCSARCSRRGTATWPPTCPPPTAPPRAVSRPSGCWRSPSCASTCSARRPGRGRRACGWRTSCRSSPWARAPRAPSAWRGTASRDGSTRSRFLTKHDWQRDRMGGRCSGTLSGNARCCSCSRPRFAATAPRPTWYGTSAPVKTAPPSGW
mmetsp:Transcript_37486/g.120493  ORF Transcript_37486/g.120493 Transcript_37486/m.120493 type:complete len:206 (-) Transcript_37486:598-1215(-)